MPICCCCFSSPPNNPIQSTPEEDKPLVIPEINGSGQVTLAVLSMILNVGLWISGLKDLMI